LKRWIAAVVLFFILAGLPLCAQAEDCTVYEAEDAELYGNNEIVEEADASSGAAVGMFTDDDSYLVFRVDIPRNGYYDLTFTIKGIGNEKVNLVYVDGTVAGKVACKCEEYSESILQKTPLSAGSHEIAVRREQGWIYLDCMSITRTRKLAKDIYDVTAPLVNPNATPETQQLYRFLCDCYGCYTLSGQFCDGGIEGDELEAIFSVTGKYPAILGLDMRDYAPSRMYFGVTSSAVEHAISYNNLGGIVSFCWHWNAPPNTILPGINDDGNPYWWGGSYANNTTFNIQRALLGEDPEGKELIDRDIRAIAEQLKRLEEKHVPVLWRPLHEAAGKWFWWGACGADCYKQLWVYLYKQLTEIYECNNLIWVWCGQDPAWYPGDEYVDILGEDIYIPPRQYSTYAAKFADLTEYSAEPKVIALTENGVLPDMDACAENGVLWSWFCTWKREYVFKDGEYSPEYTDIDMLKKTYHHEFVLTLDELAELRRE
jgi:Beta-mannanase